MPDEVPEVPITSPPINDNIDDIEPEVSDSYNEDADSTPDEDDTEAIDEGEGDDWEKLGYITIQKIERDIIAQVPYIRRWWKRDDFLRWFMRRRRVGWRFDHMLIFRAYFIWRELNRQGDHFTVIVGREGQGKSTLGSQFNSWISPNSFNVPAMCYNGVQLLNNLDKIAENYEASKGREKKSLQMDEGGMDLFAREAMRGTNVWLNKTFFAQRFLNVHTTICIPNFYMLDSGVREHRVKTLILVTNRGHYKAIVGEGIRMANDGIHEYRKQLGAVPIPKGFYWTGRFSAQFPNTMSKVEYEKDKLKNIRAFLKSALKGIKDDKRGRDF